MMRVEQLSSQANSSKHYWEAESDVAWGSSPLDIL
jgi:hypothetical protein